MLVYAVQRDFINLEDVDSDLVARGCIFRLLKCQRRTSPQPELRRQPLGAKSIKRVAFEGTENSKFAHLKPHRPTAIQTFTSTGSGETSARRP